MVSVSENRRLIMLTVLLILGAGAVCLFGHMVGRFVNLMSNSKKEKR